MRRIRILSLGVPGAPPTGGGGGFATFTGTQVFYDKFIERLHDGVIDLGTATLKLALTSDTIGSPPGGGATATDPRFGSGGSQNLSTNEVSGSGYTAGGVTVSGASGWVAGTGGRTEYQANDGSWTQTVGGPSDITFGVLYVDDANKYAISYIEMDDTGSAISLADDNINVEWTGGIIFHAQGTQPA